MKMLVDVQIIVRSSSASRSENDLGINDFSVENVLNGISENGFQSEFARNGIMNEDGDNKFIDEDENDQNDFFNENEVYEKYFQSANEIEGRRTFSEEEIRDISVKVKHSGEEKEVLPLFDCSKPDDLFNTYMQLQLNDLFEKEKRVQYECEYTKKALSFLKLPKGFNYLEDQKLTVMIHEKAEGKKIKRGLNIYDLSTKVSWKFLCNLHQVRSQSYQELHHALLM
ncbi:unnamed protein product [Cylicocyclus nassatus]|uniref:Uncharacterized protein n=1 Tax=Cylicocyclus nassatus TaxID=53992 RepID=A0AA36DQ75_CYLNA|nr:unnamed protein product [Cylicocyclus nassatus]